MIFGKPLAPDMLDIADFTVLRSREINYRILRDFCYVCNTVTHSRGLVLQVECLKRTRPSIIYCSIIYCNRGQGYSAGCGAS